jgi:hypothetical protein
MRLHAPSRAATETGVRPASLQHAACREPAVYIPRAIVVDHRQDLPVEQALPAILQRVFFSADE